MGPPQTGVNFAYFMLFYIFALWPSTVEDIALNSRPGSTTLIAGITYVFFVSHISTTNYDTHIQNSIMGTQARLEILYLLSYSYLL
jgi:hypothetical protein